MCVIRDSHPLAIRHSLVQQSVYHTAICSQRDALSRALLSKWPPSATLSCEHLQRFHLDMCSSHMLCPGQDCGARHGSRLGNAVRGGSVSRSARRQVASMRPNCRFPMVVPPLRRLESLALYAPPCLFGLSSSYELSDFDILFSSCERPLIWIKVHPPYRLEPF